MEINNTHIHFKKLEKEQIKLKERTRKKIINIKTKINGMESKFAMEKINKGQNCSLKKANKIIKHQARAYGHLKDTNRML